MQALRRAHALTRLVLGVFLLALGVAVASPLVNPRSMELVCSVGGVVKLVDPGSDGSGPDAERHHLDCPLCLVAGSPPPAPIVLPSAFFSSLSIALRPVEAAHIAGRTAAPLPPRGPPAHS